MTNQTKKQAFKLANNYLNRLKTGEFKSYKDMNFAILSNVVNSQYNRNSNLFITYFWECINTKYNS